MEARKYYDEDDREGEETLAAAEIQADREAIAERQAAEKAAAEKSEAAKPAQDASQDAGSVDDGHLKSEGDSVGGGGIVVGTGARLADDRSWEKDYESMLNRRAVARAGREAAQGAKNNLLASGRYFDDGRGNIKLKKEYRRVQRVGNGGRRTYNETLADDGSAARYIERTRDAALDSAWDTALAQSRADMVGRAERHTQSSIRANREAASARQQARAEREVNDAKSKLAVFDGLASALDALRADASNAPDATVSVWGGKDEKGRDARWKYDEQGRVVGQADARKVAGGKQTPSGGRQTEDGGFRKGFVDPIVLKTINEKLKERGANYALTGIMARQKYGALNKPLEGTTPMFYVQGVKNDGSQSGRYMTLKDVYRIGVEGFRLANGKSAEDGMAEEFAINALGGYDPDGYLKYQKKSSSSGLTFEQRMGLENQKFEGRKTLKQMDIDSKRYTTDANNATRRDIANINSDTQLTIAEMNDAIKQGNLELAKQKLSELERHNKATESQGQQRVDETTRHNKAGEAHRTAELDERKRANAEKENAVKETLELKRKAQALRERILNNPRAAQQNPASVRDGLREIETIQKVLENNSFTNDGLTSENCALLQDRLNSITEALYGGTTNKGTVKTGDNKGNGTRQNEPEGAQRPQGAIAFGGYKRNKRTGEVVPYWLDANNRPIYR